MRLLCSYFYWVAAFFGVIILISYPGYKLGALR